MQIESTVTSGKFRLDGGEWDVDNNVYVLGDSFRVYIVDPSHDLDAVAELVGDRKVEGIILTHGHNDHCELAPEAAERFDTDVYMHPDDDMLWKETNGDAHYIALADNGQFDINGEKITVYHTPGHSPGCVVLYVAGTLLSGDTLFNGGPGATGRKYSDFDVIIESLRNVVFSLPDDTKVLPGHGDATTVGAEAARIDEYIERGY
ncbi:MBL fold metallo-hydrolase [Corynebacterium macginleyi]|uniref:MBL fold metallo-hydrolase n=1 Tax=Corynebacterium macginleyi TaxID=38290 RepID=UPI00190C5AA2|nr:MBL fold metallo-hydrolase [Corynebacterium macginleyi]MBK4149453.1 MBL fold metallo-hydrolase [Corynebacterium macginleyi]MBK4159861.1 MBL fold metallo-hydrolase [Corynebacterium macginleyi]